MDVVLRDFSERDDDALEQLMDDADVRQWNPMKGGDAPGWRALRAQDDDSKHTWAVGAADGRLLGTVSVFSVDRDQGTCEVGYRVVPRERGQGVATAALRLAARHVFDEEPGCAVSSSSTRS